MKEQKEFELDLSNDEFNPAPLVGDAAPNAAPKQIRTFPKLSLFNGSTKA